MNYFACVSLDVTSLLVMLGVASLIAVVPACLIAVVMSWVFRAPVQTMLGVEAIALLICACIAGLLAGELGGIVILALLGVAACAVILMMNWLFVLVRRERRAEQGEGLCLSGPAQ